MTLYFSQAALLSSWR